MDQNAYFKTVLDKLSKDGFELIKDKISEFDVIVATKKQFKVSWVATQLNIFAIMGVSNNVSKEVIENFSETSIDYAIKNNKGLPRGLQAGVVSFALLVSPNVDGAAKQWVQQKPKKHFAAFEMPAIFDLKTDELCYCTKTPIFGAIYYGFFRDFIKKSFSPIDY